MVQRREDFFCLPALRVSPEDDLQDRGDQAEQDRRDQEADQRGGGEYAEKPW